jgi:oligosaccharide repeat unit polymerase
MIVVLLMGTIASGYLGRHLYRRWLNPLSIYSFIWGLCLISYELRLLQYYAISGTAWLYIGLAWCSFHLGAGTAFLWVDHNTGATPAYSHFNFRRLRTAIIILCFLGIIVILSQIIVLRREFGSVLDAVLFHSNDIYLGRTGGEFSFFPYVGACLFAANSLSGAYTAKTGRISCLSVVPMLLEAVNAIFGMARGGVLIAGFLFATSFLLTPRTQRSSIKMTRFAYGVGLLIVSLVVGEVSFVNSTRRLQTDFPGKTNAMEVISEYVPPAPSLYSNVSATVVAFSLYLDSPKSSRTGFWGMNTFAPIYRLLAKLGFPTQVPIYEENYYTPVPMNTSTYLKDVDSDFGLSGVAVFPYCLGLATSFLALRIATSSRLVHIVLLSHLALIITASFAINLMFTGDWPISVLVGVVASLAVEGRKSNTQVVLAEL